MAETTSATRRAQLLAEHDRVTGQLLDLGVDRDSFDEGFADSGQVTAERGEAEERYGDYVDLVETGTEVLADLRDNFASTLDEDAAEEYEDAFNRAVLKRFRRFALEIEER